MGRKKGKEQKYQPLGDAKPVLKKDKKKKKGQSDKTPLLGEQKEETAAAAKEERKTLVTKLKTEKKAVKVDKKELKDMPGVAILLRRANVANPVSVAKHSQDLKEESADVKRRADKSRLQNPQTGVASARVFERTGGATFRAEHLVRNHPNPSKTEAERGTVHVTRNTERRTPQTKYTAYHHNKIMKK
tara:strand:- start:334 stop:897 length:564 start_codon:yes stop_codon:yes gene_type:complete